MMEEAVDDDAAEAAAVAVVAVNFDIDLDRWEAAAVVAVVVAAAAAAVGDSKRKMLAADKAATAKRRSLKVSLKQHSAAVQLNGRKTPVNPNRGDADKDCKEQSWLGAEGPPAAAEVAVEAPRWLEERVADVVVVAETPHLLY